VIAPSGHLIHIPDIGFEIYPLSQVKAYKGPLHVGAPKSQGKQTFIDYYVDL